MLDSRTFLESCLRFDGHKHGKGKLEYVNGDVYDGDWVMDTWHGKAMFVNSKGDVYDGGASLISKFPYDISIEYRNNKKNGFGKIVYYATGDRYEGNWVDDIREGYGKYVYTSGQVYEGSTSTTF